MKFKVGDKVVKSDRTEWSNGEKYKIIINVDVRNGKTYYELTESVLNWYNDELKLYEEEQKYMEQQTEFTFEEIFKLKNGKVYENINTTENVKTIRVMENGVIRITYANKNNEGVIISNNRKFKLQEPKKKIQIIKVAHGKGRKPYEFIGIINQIGSCGMINEGDFVECDTKYGSSYGRCVGIIIKELTESEIKEYKKCWRA